MKSFFKILFVILIMTIHLPSKAGVFYISLDTAGVSPPYPVWHHFCTSDIDSVYLIQPNISGMTGVTWYVTNYPLPYIQGEDTILITQQYAGMVQMTSNEGYLREIGIMFYTQPPANATFSLIGGGGSVNASNDTIFMCGSSVLLTATASIYGESYALLTGPAGFWYENTMPLTLTTPGTYIYRRDNPCGITRDTFELVAPPMVLPVFADTAFCNTAVSLILDAGPGWSYDWSTGETTQSISISSAGSYTVDLLNMCASGTVDVLVEQQTYPVPDLHYLEGFTMCSDSVVVLDPSPGYTYDTYEWQWNTGTSTSPTVSISGLTTGGGLYTVTVTKGGCSETAYAAFQFFQQPMKPEVCIVTVNPVINKNLLVTTANFEPLLGDPDYCPIAYYNVYKWAGGTNWILLGTIPVDQDHIFTDMTSNPPSVSARYKITMVDECGVESEMSFYHKTIHLSSSLGSLPGEINLDWGSDGGYEDESGTFVVDQYQIWRGNHPDSLEYYDQTPFTAYTDQGVVGQKYYQIVAVRPDGCDPAAHSKSTRETVTGSFSNITNNVVSKTFQQYTNSISIFPNPATSQINIITDQNINSVTVYSITGQEMIKLNNAKTIDVSGLAVGSYSVKIVTDSGVAVERVVVE